MGKADFICTSGYSVTRMEAQYAQNMIHDNVMTVDYEKQAAR